MKRLNYVVIDFECVTPCPYGVMYKDKFDTTANVFVGSAYCTSECGYCEVDDWENSIVECNYEEK